MRTCPCAEHFDLPFNDAKKLNDAWELNASEAQIMSLLLLLLSKMCQICSVHSSISYYGEMNLASEHLNLNLETVKVLSNELKCLSLNTWWSEPKLPLNKADGGWSVSVCPVELTEFRIHICPTPNRILVGYFFIMKSLQKNSFHFTSLYSVKWQ